MAILVHAEIHGLAGRIGDLRELLRTHAEQLRGAPGSLGATAYAPIGGEPGELVLDAWWRDEGSMRSHYRTPEYAEYVQGIAELLGRPSDVTIHTVEHSYRPAGDLSMEPGRQD